MIECKKVFLDTTPIIYFLDEDMNFGNKVESILSEIIENEIEMATSTITCMEYLTYLLRWVIQRKLMHFLILLRIVIYLYILLVKKSQRKPPRLEQSIKCSRLWMLYNWLQLV